MMGLAVFSETVLKDKKKQKKKTVSSVKHNAIALR